MKSKFHRFRFRLLADHLYRNKWMCFLFLFFFYHIKNQYNFVSPSFPHWHRIGRLIGNVAKYSKMLSLDYVMDNPQFALFADRLKSMGEPPYVIFFDNSNLEVTINHICNLKYFNGELKRLVAVAFEADAEQKLNEAVPFIPTVTVDFTKVKKRIPRNLENKKYVTYQLVLLLRARIAAALATMGIDFWAMQQDSIWTTNFGDLGLEAEYPEANLLFDTVGNDQFRIFDLMKGWICGSTFFVRANPTTADFFDMVAQIMTQKQSPDSSIMTYLCGAGHYKCVKLPKDVVSNSNYFLGNRNITPAVVQIDHESKLSKIDLFKKNNLYFRKKDGTCDLDPVKHIKWPHSAFRKKLLFRKYLANAMPEVREEETLDDTPLWLKIWRATKEFIGFDPYRHKIFLTVHHPLV